MRGPVLALCRSGLDFPLPDLILALGVVFMSNETQPAEHHAEGHDHAPNLKLYWVVGAVLFVGTIVTVAVGWVGFSVFTTAVIVALTIAIIKGAFVASVYMHLWGEKRVIWWTLALCAIFFTFLIVLPVITTQSNAGKKISPRVEMRDKAEHEAEGGTKADKTEGKAEEKPAPAEAH